MPDLYIKTELLKNAAVANEADNDDVFDVLVEAVSRMFDRECEVPDGFFNAAPDSGVTLKSYIANGTKYLQLSPYIPGTITIIDVDGDDRYEAVTSDREYQEKEGFLIFDSEICSGIPIDVTARYGFAAIPADVQQACIEQALMMWRRKDLTFADISGVATAAVVAEFSPTFIAVTTRYRGIYSQNSLFA
jgi:hypothetical protein